MAKNQLRIGAVMSYLNMAIGTIIPMLYTPIMLELLGQSEYGLFKLSSTVTSYLSLISLGIGSAVVRYLVKFKAEGDTEGEQKMFGLFNVIFSVISAIALIVGVIITVFVPFLYSDSLTSEELLSMRIIVLILSVNTAFNLSTTAYSAVVTCHERFIFLQFINILTTVVTPIANIVFMLLGFKSIGMAISTLALSVIVRTVYIVYIKLSVKIKPIYKNMPVYLIKELLVFSFWIFVGQLVNQLYAATDTLIIGAIPALATIGVAIYNVGATFNNMMLSFTLGITNVLSPKINTMVFQGSNTEELTTVLIRFGRLQGYIVSLVCCGFIAFGQPFINLWAGADYSEAYWVALLTMVPSCVPLMQSVALSIITAQNKHRFRALVYLSIAIANIAGTLVAVQYWGIIGAAVVSGIAYVIGQGFVLNWYYWKKIGLNIPRFWKSVLGIFIVPIILCIAFLVLQIFIQIQGWILMLSGVALFTVLFIVLSWIFVMNDYEKDIFKGPVKKIIGKFRKSK